MKYALFDYVPRRFQQISFELQDVRRMILGFKDGRNVYTRWAAKEFARALSAMDMTNTVVVCVPASTMCAHVRRWKLFSKLLCRQTGAIDGFSHVQVCGNRKRAHITGEYELCNNIKHLLNIDAEGLTAIEVYDINGRVVATYGAENKINIASLPAGAYTLRIQTQQGNHIRRIILK